MSQKNYLKIYNSFLFMSISTRPILKTKRLTPQIVSSLEVSHSPKLGNTGKFFKKLAFIGLAYNNVLFNKGRLATIKSVIRSLWNTIATYVMIF